ncbi:MAG: AAA family ATPase [Oscillospiraceae bacterium]|nr:AAA family ATPase [Oscillospiraceae bacterium]
MRISEAKKCITELYKNTESVIALVSERGVGKTSAFQQCADEMEIGYMGLYAAAMEGPDFMGLPDKDREKGITRYLAPQFLPTNTAVQEGLFPDKGLLVIEEINRVPSDTISVLYPLLLERKINNHSLAPGWRIGVTMNPDTLNYTVNVLDDAMLDRFIAVEVTADIEDYITYSIQNDPCDDVLAYLKSCPDMLLRVKKAADSTATSKSPTPRGWTKVQQLLNRCSLPDELMQELISGILGPETAASFLGYLKNREYTIPSAAAVLSDYESVKPQTVKLVQNGRLDIISLVMNRVVSLVDGTSGQCDNLDKMLADMTNEFQLLFFKALSNEKPESFLEIAGQIKMFDSISDQLMQSLT